MPYKLESDLNGIDLLRGAKILNACAACGNMPDKWHVTVNSASVPRYDFSKSRDGFPMVSPAYKRFYDERGFTGARFKPLLSGYFVIIPEATVRMDLVFMKVRYWRPCPVCGANGEISVHGDPRLAADERPIGPKEYVRSETDFSDVSVKSFMVIVGDEVRRALFDVRFKGGEPYHKVG